MDNYFYGWYFRCQGKEETVAVNTICFFSKKHLSLLVKEV